MKVKVIESRDVVVDIVPEFLVRDLKCNWLETILGCEQAYPRDGKWYYNFYSAYPDFGEPGDGIREATSTEEAI